MSYYPVFLDLRGQRCVVIGGGPQAARKAAGLLDAGARVNVIAPNMGAELLTLETATAGKGIHLFHRAYRPGDLTGATLAIDASGDPSVGRAVRQEADREGVLLNVMDVPEQCDFIAPAVVKRGALQVAISTSGESPFIASSLRAQLEEALGDEWREFVALVGALRRDLRQRRVPLSEQTRIYQRLLASPVLDLLREGAVAAARREAERIVRTAVPTEVGGS